MKHLHIFCRFVYLKSEAMNCSNQWRPQGGARGQGGTSDWTTKCKKTSGKFRKKYKMNNYAGGTNRLNVKWQYSVTLMTASWTDAVRMLPIILHFPSTFHRLGKPTGVLLGRGSQAGSMVTKSIPRELLRASFTVPPPPPPPPSTLLFSFSLPSFPLVSFLFYQRRALPHTGL